MTYTESINRLKRILRFVEVRNVPKSKVNLEVAPGSMFRFIERTVKGYKKVFKCRICGKLRFYPWTITAHLKESHHIHISEEDYRKLDDLCKWTEEKFNANDLGKRK